MKETTTNCHLGIGKSELNKLEIIRKCELEYIVKTLIGLYDNILNSLRIIL